jgi:hypothetical protein
MSYSTERKKLFPQSVQVQQYYIFIIELTYYAKQAFLEFFKVPILVQTVVF